MVDQESSTLGGGAIITYITNLRLQFLRVSVSTGIDEVVESNCLSIKFIHPTIDDDCGLAQIGLSHPFAAFHDDNLAPDFVINCTG